MSANPSARTSRIAADVTEVLAPIGLLVEDISVAPAGKRRIVRVLVDRVIADDADPEAQVPPLDLDEVAEATRVVSECLDETDAMGEQPYVLEVSSPGTDRPLVLPRHFRRNIGRLIRLDGEGNVAGRIRRADAEGFDLEVVGKAGRMSVRTVTYADEPRAHVELEFNRPDGGEDD
ncbi:ribosome maturation factor RimP [Rudaeicoccus suwonensis]|uniref:Ribosome maturation factor RimP n=1 Tax=Rudaeicoccus suwonensis TaxID=657409 RepID=A0A561E9I9_9MICO|nr:ribosome maturation factor RimP [Rudaeicoccus suwonensis]TWE12288.1 ribosome maturation factor RimP [Rudaeicoccus suwonensis]